MMVSLCCTSGWRHDGQVVKHGRPPAAWRYGRGYRRHRRPRQARSGRSARKRPSSQSKASCQPVIFPRHRGVEERRVVGRDRDLHAPVDTARPIGCSRQLGIDPKRDVRPRADLQHDALFGQFVHQRQILDRAHAVADALGPQVAQRIAHALRPAPFARMGGQPQPRLARAVEGPGEILGLRRSSHPPRCRTPTIQSPAVSAAQSAVWRAFSGPKWRMQVMIPRRVMPMSRSA